MRDIPQAGVDRILLLQIALHSAICNAVILAILFAIHIASLMALASRLESKRTINRFDSLKKISTALPGRDDSPVRDH